MTRRITALILAVALAGLITAPVDAKRKPKKLRPKVTTYQMNWGGDCAGGGYLALKAVPNADACALYFPELGNSYSFPAMEGLGFKLNAKKQLTVEFTLSHAATAAGEFEAVVDAIVKGKDVELGRQTQAVTAASFGPGTRLKFEIDPNDKLNKGKVSGLIVTIAWTGGVTYSQIDFEAGAPVVVHGYK